MQSGPSRSGFHVRPKGATKLKNYHVLIDDHAGRRIVCKNDPVRLGLLALPTRRLVLFPGARGDWVLSWVSVPREVIVKPAGHSLLGKNLVFLIYRTKQIGECGG